MNMLMSLENKVGKIRDIYIPKFRGVRHERFMRTRFPDFRVISRFPCDFQISRFPDFQIST